MIRRCEFTEELMTQRGGEEIDFYTSVVWPTGIITDFAGGHGIDVVIGLAPSREKAYKRALTAQEKHQQVSERES